MPLPVMPKGVEHPKYWVPYDPYYLVPLPVMPKGVEHMCIATAALAASLGAPPSDAERR